MRDLELTNRARAMRKEMTEPETRLWLELRAKRFAEVKFRRQKVIQDEQHRYIVDFAANDPKLVIELDGDSHAASDSYDAARTKFLESKGYHVLRYANDDVIRNMDGVLQHLAGVIEQLRTQPPLPTLSPEGERAIFSLSPSGERVGERGTP
jgi:very-short-patch-repair endonuclease